MSPAEINMQLEANRRQYTLADLEKAKADAHTTGYNQGVRESAEKAKPLCATHPHCGSDYCEGRSDAQKEVLTLIKPV